MGFCRVVLVLHAVSAAVFLSAVAYVFLLPRLTTPLPTMQVGRGGISHNSFFVAIVAPPANVEECRGKCVGRWVKVVWRPVEPTLDEHAQLASLEGNSFDSGFFQPTEAEDFNVVVPLTSLRPNTEYQYRVIVQMTAHATGELYISHFRTLAAPRDADAPAFSFAFGSCLMSRSWPFDVVALMDAEGPVMAREPRPSFAMLLGDSVYLDAPYKLKPRVAYRQLLENKGFRRLNWQFPTFFQMDDHEIRNDADDIDSEEFRNATREFDVFLGRRNAGAMNVRYHSFWSGRAAFVLLDARGHRSPTHSEDGPNKTMLGASQKSFLRAWAEETKDAAVRFVVSPVPWSASVTGGDGWRFYMREREEVLDWLEGGAKTVLLSGDLHFALVAEIRPGLHEVSVSPISSMPLRTKIGALQKGEKVLFTSQFKQHFGRVDVGTAGEVHVSIYSEIPGLGPKLQIQTVL